MRNIIILILTLVSFHVSVVEASLPKEVTIGFIPGEGEPTVSANAKVLAKKLQAVLKVPIKILVSRDYAGLIDAMKEDKIQFGFFSAVTFVFAEKEAGAKVLMKKVWDHPFYYSVVLSLNSSKIRNISEMRGKKIAFVDEKSASGYLYPAVMFKRNGIHLDSDLSGVVFSGNHAKSVELLEKGEVQLAAVYADDSKGLKSAWEKFKVGKKSPKVRVNWVSQAIPTDPFCVKKTFYDQFPHFTHDLMYALIELSDTGGENFIKKTLGASALQLATSRQYDPVRDMVSELKLGMK